MGTAKLVKVSSENLHDFACDLEQEAEQRKKAKETELNKEIEELKKSLKL